MGPEYHQLVYADCPGKTRNPAVFRFLYLQLQTQAPVAWSLPGCWGSHSGSPACVETTGSYPLKFMASFFINCFHNIKSRKHLCI